MPHEWNDANNVASRTARSYLLPLRTHRQRVWVYENNGELCVLNKRSSTTKSKQNVMSENWKMSANVVDLYFLCELSQLDGSRFSWENHWMRNKQSSFLSFPQDGVKWNSQFSRWLNCVHVAMDKLCGTQNVISLSEWVQKRKWTARCDRRLSEVRRKRERKLKPIYYTFNMIHGRFYFAERYHAVLGGRRWLCLTRCVTSQPK